MHEVALSLLRTSMRAQALLSHSTTSSPHRRRPSLFLDFPHSLVILAAEKYSCNTYVGESFFPPMLMMKALFWRQEKSF